MYRQHYLPTTGRCAVAATRRRWSRRMLAAGAACVLGLLPGIPGVAPTGPAVVQAAQSDQPHAPAPAGGMAGAVPPIRSGPTDYPPNLIVQSTGVRDEQLDVAAALDQGTRLFLLQGRYQDAGNGQADYYLAGPQGVSHQPLRVLFAPLVTWMAGPGHEHATVMLGLRTDPRSANPARFDAACQAFMSALGPYLLKSSDLPAGKSLKDLTPHEQAVLRSQPRVVTDWSACTGEEPPLARPQTQPATAVPVKDHWMADQKDILGQRPLRQVVIPGSHDAATYEDSSCPAGECWAGGKLEAPYIQAQSQDVTAQLNAGSRYLDLRFSYADQEGYGGKNFYNFHGTDKSGNPFLSYLQMGVVLYAIVTWINQPGHEREIVWLDIQVYREDQGQRQSKTICNQNLGWELAQGKVLQSSMLPPNTALTDMSMNEIWSLPGHPQIIVTGWSSCTGDDPMTKGGAYANQCGGNVWSTIGPELFARTDWMTGKLVTGAYTLDIQSTPFSSFICTQTVRDLAPEQNGPLNALKSLLDFPTGPSSRVARANLNVVAGDFLGDPAGEGDGNWPIVQTALTLNQQLSPVTLSLTGPSAPASVTVSCNNPTGFGPTTMIVYPVVEGPQSPNLKTFTTDQSGSLQGSVSRSDFPGAGAAPDGNYLVAACARGGSPLDPPGSSGAEISRIVLPLSLFVPWPQLVATPADPVDLPFTCSAPGTAPIQVTAYPAGDPFSPDAQVFRANGTVQATYSRRGGYDVRLNCDMGVFTSLLVPDSAFPPALTIRADHQDRWLYCDRASQLKSPFELSLAAQTPNGLFSLDAVGSDMDKTVVLTVKPDYFPPGDYLLKATCVSEGQKQTWTATPLILSSNQIPTSKLFAEITGCSAQQHDKPYACALQVTLGAPLAVNKVFSVGIRYVGTDGDGFANPGGGDRPQVTVIQGCQVPPLPSPYLKDGNGHYTRYDVNIGPGGCSAGAVVTFGEAVTGAATTEINQPVTVPGLGASTAGFVLPY